MHNSWTPAFTKLWPPGSCVFLYPIKIWTQIRHLPLSILQSPSSARRPHIWQHSALIIHRTHLCWASFSSLPDLLILPGCCLPGHHSDTQRSWVAVCFQCLNTHNQRCCLLPSDSPVNPFLSVPNNFYLTH